jgi:hypothetical protein
VPQESSTPSKERNLPNIFRSTPNTDTGDKRQPNKLKKKRIPGSLNPSAQSSAASLTYTHPNAASSPGAELANPMEHAQQYESGTQALPQQPAPILEEQHREALEQQQELHDRPSHGQNPQETSLAHPASLTQQKSDVSSEHTPRASQASSNQSLHPDNTLKSKKSPPTSLHSSFNEGSDLDQILDEQSVSTVDQAEKERKKRWRLSRSKNADNGSSAGLTSPRLALGQNDNGDVSNLSISSSSHRPRKSESSDRPYMVSEGQGSFDPGRESDSKGPIGWIRNKYREAKESAEQRRNKSPPPADRPGLGASSFQPRGKSLEIRRDEPTQHASLAAIAGAPAVASNPAAAPGPALGPAPTTAQIPQTATVSMVQPEPTSPVQPTHPQAQAPPPAQVQAQPQPQPTTPAQPPVQEQTQSPVEPKLQTESQKPQSPQTPQKIISMLDVDTPPAAATTSTPVPTVASVTTQPQAEEPKHAQEQPQPLLSQEPKAEEKPAQATEQPAVISPVQPEQVQPEQPQVKSESETPKQEQ